MNPYPLVSIIIPIVRNDPHIKGCIEAIEKSTYRNYEIIVVDEGLERSAQRNIGIRRAICHGKGKYLLWLDSDMRIHEKVLEDCADKITKGCVGIYIPERIVTEGWFGRLRDWERQFYNGTLVDVMRFVWLDDAPLFDENLHGVEDSDWERQIFRRNPFSKVAICDYPVYHHDRCGVIKYLKKKAYYARCLNKYRAKNPNDRLLTFKYRCFDVFVQNGKWKRFISKPHYALGVMLLLFARGLIFLWAKIRY